MPGKISEREIAERVRKVKVLLEQAGVTVKFY